MACELEIDSGSWCWPAGGLEWVEGSLRLVVTLMICWGRRSAGLVMAGQMGCGAYCGGVVCGRCVGFCLAWPVRSVFDAGVGRRVLEIGLVLVTGIARLLPNRRVRNRWGAATGWCLLAGAGLSASGTADSTRCSCRKCPRRRLCFACCRRRARLARRARKGSRRCQRVVHLMRPRRRFGIALIDTVLCLRNVARIASCWREMWAKAMADPMRCSAGR